MDIWGSVRFFLGQCGQFLLSPGSPLSLSSLAAALFIATAFYAGQRVKRGRRLRWRTLWRALFPKRIVNARSNQADIGYLFFNVFVFGIVFGWAILSYQSVSHTVADGAAALFGAREATTLPSWVPRVIITVMLFLAYELGYWFNHWLSHKVPLLWELHKVHHSAAVLTPLTNFRVHPLYALLFANILALSAALANGLGHYLFGQAVPPYAVNDTNMILVLFIHVYVHLQHSHVWISFQGLLGRVFISPAHHQVHHSADPKHFNKNFGSCLALWDWMFGTLYVPAKRREAIEFGFPGDPDAHTVKGELINPLLNAVGHLTSQWPKKAPIAAAPVPDTRG